jgi:hypothetical protein
MTRRFAVSPPGLSFPDVQHAVGGVDRLTSSKTSVLPTIQRTATTNFLPTARLQPCLRSQPGQAGARRVMQARPPSARAGAAGWIRLSQTVLSDPGTRRARLAPRPAPALPGLWVWQKTMS